MFSSSSVFVLQEFKSISYVKCFLDVKSFAFSGNLFETVILKDNRHNQIVGKLVFTEKCEVNPDHVV